MKVAYDHQIFGLQRHGGISRYFAELVENLLSEPDIEPSVISPVHINAYLRRDSIKHKVTGVHLGREFRGRIRMVRLLNNALAPVAWFGRSADIIHETYYSPTPTGHGKARVLTVYDMIHELYPSEFPDSQQISEAKRRAARRADHVICISETTRQDAVDILGISAEQTSVVYLGHALERCNVAPCTSRIAPCILYVGLRGGYKNFKVLLEAFASSPKLAKKLPLVAFGGPKFSPEELATIDGFGLAGRVRWVSGDDSLLRAYYSAAVAFVYPSRYEGFGIPPLEAMGAGCPVICSTAPSVREVVGDAAAYFAPDDSVQLGEILWHIADDEQYRQELRLRGTERIKRYSWSRCARETKALYERLHGVGTL